MIIKVSKKQPWTTLEIVIPNSRESIRNAIKNINDKGMCAWVDMHSEYEYSIVVTRKIECELKIYKENGESYIHIDFLNKFENKSIRTLEELDSSLMELVNSLTLIKPKFNAIRKEKYSINSVLSKVSDLPRPESNIEFEGDSIRMNNLRYHMFLEKGIKCVCCGIEGKYFYKEKDIGRDKFHFNLYAINNEGEEVRMTKDHIIPKSKGGETYLYNMQTMCVKCNAEKGDNYTMPIISG